MVKWEDTSLRSFKWGGWRMLNVIKPSVCKQREVSGTDYSQIWRRDSIGKHRTTGSVRLLLLWQSREHEMQQLVSGKKEA